VDIFLGENIHFNFLGENKMIRLFYILIVGTYLIPSGLLASSELIKEEASTAYNLSKRGIIIDFEVQPEFLSVHKTNTDRKLREIKERNIVYENNALRGRLVLSIGDFPRLEFFLENRNEQSCFFSMPINKQMIFYFLKLDLRVFPFQLARNNKSSSSRRRLESIEIEDSIVQVKTEESELPLSVEKLRSSYSDIEINKDISVVSLREWQWNGIPLAVLIFEKINPVGDALDSYAYTFRAQNINNSEEVNPFFSSAYKKSKGRIFSFTEEQQQLFLNNQNQGGNSWQLDTFYIDKALSSIKRMQGKFLSFVFESKEDYWKLKLPESHYTSASFAAYILQEYCYISGLDLKPFKSDLTVDSLIEISRNASLSSIQKPAEGEVGSFISKLYSLFIDSSNSKKGE